MNICFVCHQSYGSKISTNPIDDTLASQWSISPAMRGAFDKREGQCCPHCWSNVRAETLGKAIMGQYDLPAKDFGDFIKLANKRRLKIAEINSCHGLHKKLTGIKDLAYSEYNSDDGDGKTPHEDILALTYADNSFDMILHSETLEHVPDPAKALKECRRILKKDGVCLFSIPIILNRKTKQRIKTKNNKSPHHIHSKSFHGFGRDDCLVWWEFGGDFIRDNGLKIVYSAPKYQTYILGLSKVADNESSIALYKLAERTNLLWENLKLQLARP